MYSCFLSVQFNLLTLDSLLFFPQQKHACFAGSLQTILHLQQETCFTVYCEICPMRLYQTTFETRLRLVKNKQTQNTPKSTFCNKRAARAALDE